MGLRKLRREAERSKRSRLSEDIGARRWFHRGTGRSLSAWWLVVCRRKHARELMVKGRDRWRGKVLREAVSRLMAYRKEAKVKRLMRVAALMLRKKHVMGLCFKAWRGWSRRRAVLRCGTECGMRLMMVLAWKRWRGGALNVKIRRRLIR